MINALEFDGQPVEPEWPYLPSLPTDISLYAPPPNVSKLFHYRGEQLSDLSEAEVAIGSGWPVIMGLNLSDAFYRVNSSRVLGGDADFRVVGRHAVLAVGLFSENSETGFIIRNSWGSKWGDDGHAYVLKAYIEPRTLFLGVYRA